MMTNSSAQDQWGPRQAAQMCHKKMEDPPMPAVCPPVYPLAVVQGCLTANWVRRHRTPCASFSRLLTSLSLGFQIPQHLRNSVSGKETSILAQRVHQSLETPPQNSREPRKALEPRPLLRPIVAPRRPIRLPVRLHLLELLHRLRDVREYRVLCPQRWTVRAATRSSSCPMMATSSNWTMALYGRSIQEIRSMPLPGPQALTSLSVTIRSSTLTTMKRLA